MEKWRKTLEKSRKTREKLSKTMEKKMEESSKTMEKSRHTNGKIAETGLVGGAFGQALDTLESKGVLKQLLSEVGLQCGTIMVARIMMLWERLE